MGNTEWKVWKGTRRVNGYLLGGGGVSVIDYVLGNEDTREKVEKDRGGGESGIGSSPGGDMGERGRREGGKGKKGTGAGVGREEIGRRLVEGSL